MVSCRILKIQIFFIFCFGFCSGEEVIEEDDNSTAPLNLTITQECSRDLLEIARGLASLEKWAFEIVDSMEKIPSGLLLGRTTVLGQFEECLRVVHPNISMKHCVLEIGLKNQVLNTSHPVRQSNLARIRMKQFGYGVCIPSTCNAKDLENTVEVLGVNKIIKTKMVEESCLTKLKPELRTKDYFVIVLFSFIVILAVASTAYEVYASYRKAEDHSEILKSFSLLSNSQTLFGTSDKPQETDSLHGIRFFSFTWLIMGHLYAGFASTINIVNPIEMVKIFGQKSHIVGTNSFSCVDTYFFLSGFLVCLVFYRNISKTGSFDFPVALLHRYLRLTPALAAVLLFNSSLLSRLIGGPYALKSFEAMERDCTSNWWAYLLYIKSPLSKGRDACFPAVWYLCADMQMYLLSPLIMYALLLKPKHGPAILGCLTLATTLASFISCYVERVAPSFTFQFTVPNRATYTYEYFLFITRMTPWVVGLGTGFILCGIKDKKITFQPSRFWIIIGWLTAAALALISVYGIGAFYPMWAPKINHPLEAYSYRSLNKLGWALSLSWVVLACVNNCGGVINKFLSYQGFKPLARLTYCAYLNHLAVQTGRYISSLGSSRSFNNHELMYMYLGDICISLGVAVPMTLFIEIPFSRIEKILLKNMVVFPYPKSKKIENDPFAKEIDQGKNNVIKIDKSGWIVEEKNTTG